MPCDVRTIASRVGQQPGESSLDDGGELTEEVPERVLRDGTNDGSLVLEVAQPATARVSGVETNSKRCRTDATGGILAGCRESKMEIPDCGKWEEKNEAPIVIRFYPGSRDPCGHPSDNSCPRASHAEGGAPNAVRADAVPETCFAHVWGTFLSFFPLDKGFHFRAEDKL